MPETDDAGDGGTGMRGYGDAGARGRGDAGDAVAFLGDLITDPLNFVGAGLFDDIARAGRGALGSEAYTKVLQSGEMLKKAETAAAAARKTGIVDDVAMGYNKGTGSKIFSPINPGPLSNEVASSFRSLTYTKRVLTKDTVFYRVYGGGAGEVGLYMTRTPQLGGMQSQIDLALAPEWGNTATYITKVTVPKGTVIYEGFATPQTINGGAGFLMGGGSQIYIPEARLNPSWFGK